MLPRIGHPASRRAFDGRTRRLDVRVPRHGGTPGTCRAVEDVWEAVEGVADYGSWLPLHHAGFATREQLLRRYRAKQVDAFYLTGAIEMHAAQAMGSQAPAELWRRIATSESAAVGSPRAVFEQTIEEQCGVD